MGIVNDNVITPAAMTLEQQVRIQKMQMANSYKQVTTLFQRLAAFVWSNPDYSAQQVFDAYGSDGAELCRLSAAASTMLSTYTGNPVEVVPEGKSLSISEGGNVTVQG